MAVPFTRLASEAIENYGSKKAYDNLRRADAIVAALAGGGGIKFAKAGEVQMATGGTAFRQRTLYGQNSNVAHRGRSATIETNDDEGYTMSEVPIRVLDGSIVFNQVELDMVQGNPAISEGLVEDKIDQFASTWVQVGADALRQGTPGANDPFTLLPDANTGTVNGILIDRTPAQQATDAATTAGISRGDNSWWRNQYSNTSYDLTTQAGRRGLDLDVYWPCVRGLGEGFDPNVGVCARVIIASLGSGVDTNRRTDYQDASGKAYIGVDTIVLKSATLYPDSSTRFLNGTAGKIALINTRGLMLKVLKGSGTTVKDMLDQRNNLGGLPIYWKQGGAKQFENDIDSLKWVKIGYVSYNLMPLSLQDHGLADNCT